MYDSLEIDVQAGPDHAEAIQRITDDWATQLPQEVLEIRGDGLEQMGYGQGDDVLLGARHTIALLETIARDVPLSPEARKRLKDIGRPFVPYRR